MYHMSRVQYRGGAVRVDFYRHIDGYTPVYLAILVENPEAIPVLLKHGASLSARTALGNDAFAIARKEMKILNHGYVSKHII